MIQTLFLAALLAGPGNAAAPAPPANTVCPVMGGKVTPGKSPTVTVRGRTYYLCCPDCGAKLKASPDTYLKADGTSRKG